MTATGSSWDGDWLPGDTRTGASQPTSANSIGASAGEEYSDLTPASVPENFTAWTAAAPLREHSLSEIVFDPTGLARSWRRIDNLEIAGPADSVFVVDETRGRPRPWGGNAHRQSAQVRITQGPSARCSRTR